MAEAPDAQDSGLKVHTRRGRRIPRADLRDRVLREGSALLGASGVTASLYHVNMEELIRRVGVPRSSVFAAFGGKEELITELMVRLLQPGSNRSSGYSADLAAVAQQVIGQHGHRMRRADGSRDLDGEYAVLREGVRIALRQNADDMLASSEWQTFMALSASVGSLPEGRSERVTAALREVEHDRSVDMEGFYAAVMGSVGRRMCPGLEWRHLVTAGAGIVEGIITRRRIGLPVAEETVMLPGIDGEPVEWTLVAVSYLALVECMTEPIPL